MGKLGVALVGYGMAGQRLHAPLIEATEGLALRAVVTSDAGRATQARAAHPGARIVRAADELWDGADDLDLAVVANANRAHVPTACAALEAGLAVVLDKPMAPLLGGARDIVATAERTGGTLSVFHNRRWDADFLTLRALLADGRLGTVRRFESRWDRWRPEVPAGAWRERGAKEEGGGTLLDLGPHLVDQALVLFGPAAAVYAEVETRRPGAQADDDVFLALRHASGVRSHLWCSQVAGDEGRRLRVTGEGATWVKAGLDVQEAALGAGERPGGPGWGAEPEPALGWLVAGEERERTPGVPGDMGAYYRELAAALRGNGPLPVTAQDGLAVMEVLDAAQRSAAAGAVVPV